MISYWQSGTSSNNNINNHIGKIGSDVYLSKLNNDGTYTNKNILVGEDWSIYYLEKKSVIEFNSNPSIEKDDFVLLRYNGKENIEKIDEIDSNDYNIYNSDNYILNQSLIILLIK